MTNNEYSRLYQRLCSIEDRLRSARARAWMRPDLRADLLHMAVEARDDLYGIKQNEDKENGE